MCRQVWTVLCYEEILKQIINWKLELWQRYMWCFTFSVLSAATCDSNILWSQMFTIDFSQLIRLIWKTDLITLLITRYFFFQTSQHSWKCDTACWILKNVPSLSSSRASDMNFKTFSVTYFYIKVLFTICLLEFCCQ